MEKTKSKGRPVRDENDTQSNYCTIKDPMMEPFYIIKDSLLDIIQVLKMH